MSALELYVTIGYVDFVDLDFTITYESKFFS